jgi:hypothetical protein
MAQKYVVLRVADVQRLTMDQKKALMDIIRAVAQVRSAEGKADDPTFTLNMRDKYAQPAVEAYIRAAQEDGQSKGVGGVEAAIDAAQKARDAGIMLGATRLPKA